VDWEPVVLAHHQREMAFHVNRGPGCSTVSSAWGRQASSCIDQVSENFRRKRKKPGRVKLLPGAYENYSMWQYPKPVRPWLGSLQGPGPRAIPQLKKPDSGTLWDKGPTRSPWLRPPSKVLSNTVSISKMVPLSREPALLAYCLGKATVSANSWMLRRKLDLNQTSFGKD
jgi:hypothetical protein